MDNPSHDDRFAPPRAHVEDIPVAGRVGEAATRMSRLLAAVVDVFIALVLLGLISWLTPWNPWAAPSDGYWMLPQWSAAIGGFLVFALTHGWLLATRGQTIGKVLLRIRIARPDGSQASLGRVLGLRYGIGSLLTVIPALGQIWGLLDAVFIFRASRRCLHDQIADTVVLKV